MFILCFHHSLFCQWKVFVVPYDINFLNLYFRLRALLTQPRCYQSTDDQKTTARVLNQETDAGLMVDGFSIVSKKDKESRCSYRHCSSFHITF